jgi:hypothetical protein
VVIIRSEESAETGREGDAGSNVAVIKERLHDNMVDGIQFDMRAIFYYLIESFGLNDYTKVRNVEMYVTMDGAKLDDNSGHVTIGCKICDKRSEYPVAGKYIYANDEVHDDDEHVDKLQSGAWCFPILYILARDNK